MPGLEIASLRKYSILGMGDVEHRSSNNRFFKNIDFETSIFPKKHRNIDESRAVKEVLFYFNRYQKLMQPELFAVDI